MLLTNAIVVTYFCGVFDNLFKVLIDTFSAFKIIIELRVCYIYLLLILIIMPRNSCNKKEHENTEIKSIDCSSSVHK